MVFGVVMTGVLVAALKRQAGNVLWFIIYIAAVGKDGLATPFFICCSKK